MCAGNIKSMDERDKYIDSGMEKPRQGVLGRLRINRTLLPYKMFYFFCDGAMSCIAPYRSLYLKQIGLGPSRIGIVAAMKPLATFISNAMIGFLADRFGRRKVFMLTSLLLWIASLLAFGFIPPASEVAAPVSRSQLQRMVQYLNGTDVSQEEMLSRQVRSAGLEQTELDRENLRIQHQKTLDIKLHQLRCLVLHCPPHLNYTSPYPSTSPSSSSSSSPPSRHGDQEVAKKVYSKLVQEYNGNSPSLATSTARPQSPTASSSSSTSTSTPPTHMAFMYFNPSVASELASNRSWLFDERELLHLFLAILVITNVVYVSFGSFMRLADASTLSTLAKDPNSDMSDYGWHRSFGGLGWAVCSLTVGVLLSGTSTTIVRWGVALVTTDYRVAFFAFAVVATLATFCSFFMDYDYSTCDWETQWSALRRVVLSAHFSSVFFVAFFTGVCNGSVWGFLLWHFQNLGASQTLIGALEAVQSISELGLGFFSRRFLLSFGHISVLTLGLGVYALRFVCYAVITNPLWLIPVEIVHGLSFLLTWTTLVSYFGSAVPAQCMTTVQGILGALYFGLGVGVGSLASGLLIERFDAVLTFFGFAVASVVVMFLFMVVQHVFPRADIEFEFDNDTEKQREKKEPLSPPISPQKSVPENTKPKIVDFSAPHIDLNINMESTQFRNIGLHQSHYMGLEENNAMRAARPFSASFVTEIYATERTDRTIDLSQKFSAAVPGRNTHEKPPNPSGKTAAAALPDGIEVLSPLLRTEKPTDLTIGAANEQNLTSSERIPETCVPLTNLPRTRTRTQSANY